MTHSGINRGKIIIVDDDQEMREMLKDFLLGLGHQVQSFSLATEAFSRIQNNELEIGPTSEIDLIVTDLRMPEMDGVEFIQRVKKVNKEIPIVLITAFGSIESAIQATRIGAYSYIVKPFKLTDFNHIVDRAIHLSLLKKENSELKNFVSTKKMKQKIIGRSKEMKNLVELVERVSKAYANILITGESGTGKEVIARAIHELSPRKNKPFVAINCSAIPDGLLESELFGHIKGSFTGAISNKLGLFEEAEGGTLFLDEIGDLNLTLQAKLLRVLQEKKIKPVGSNKYKDVDIRIICATHKDLQKAIEEESFREDLFYRLSVIPIHIPPLRQRREDIPLLVDFFSKKFSKLNSMATKRFSPGALDKITRYKWNGNVRELENFVERLIVLSVNDEISESDVPLAGEKNVDDFYQVNTTDWPTLGELERRYIQAILERTSGRKEKASKILGINRRTLYRKELEMQNEPTI